MASVKVPFPRSYWVEEGKLLAGCYPGAPDAVAAERKLAALLDVGIRCVVNLMEPGETDHAGNPFAPYQDAIRRLAAARGIEINLVNVPVRDLSTPTPDVMKKILYAVDQSLAHSLPVYIHCWGGKGRTGTAVGCWLARHGKAQGEEVLKRVQRLRRNDPTANEPSPETSAQRDMVSRWKAGD